MTRLNLIESRESMVPLLSVRHLIKKGTSDITGALY